MNLPIYDALPPKHFRLLKISEDRGIIHISLTTFRLESAPSYVALSYTWGDAEEPYFSLGPVTPRSLPCKIVLNGQIWEITPNLQDFFSLAIQMDGIHQTWLWIDAICIDQTNTAEKTSQVKLMGKIYSQADLTFVWLGKEDGRTKQTQSMIHHIGQELKQHVGHESGKVLSQDLARVKLDNEDYLKRLGLESSTTWEDWLGLVSFLQRRWFRRVWTIQEVALAENAVLRCGPYIFDWHDLYHCTWALSNTPLGAVLRTRAERHFGTDRINFMFGVHAFTAIAVHKPGDLVTTRVFSEWNIQDNLEYGPVATWARLINFMRHSGATDPRDRIFAFGGVWERMATEPMRSALMRPANYDKSVQTVFIETMTDLLNTTSCLNFLSLVQPGSPVTPGLPSWVADYAGYSATPVIQFMAINEMLDLANASKHTSEPTVKFHISSNKLFLSTVTLGTITSVSDSWAEWNNGQFLQTLDMLSDSSKIRPDKQAVIDTFCLLLLFGMTNSKKWPEPEVYWNFFLQILLSHLSLQAQRGSTVIASLADIGPSLDAWAKSDALHRIPTLDELTLAGEKCLVWDESGCHLDSNEVDQIRDKSYELRLILLETIYGRRVFLMDTGHLGITAEDVKPGDTIRIVPGARALFTFRTAKDRYPQFEYQNLIGEAYVSGAMSGEAIEYVRSRGGNSEWEEICVV